MKIVIRTQKLRWLLPLIAIACFVTVNLVSRVPSVAAPSFTSDPLPSWNEGATKQSIVNYVRVVTDPKTKSYIPPGDRIATFDNDGTLWAEKPVYFQLAFVLERIRELAPEHPEWRGKQPFQAVLSDDPQALKNLKIPEDVLKLVLATHTGMNNEEFVQQVNQFLQNAKHPKFAQPYPSLLYQPMVELIDYLKRNDFQVYICSGGGIDFIRTFAETAYGIPPENVIGSSIQKEFHMTEDGPILERLPLWVGPINDKAGKPVNIDRHIGKRPVIAVGNSDGDIQMLQYADSNALPDLELLLHHDDGDREYDYDRGTEKALVLAVENDWTVISMQQDFKRVFP